MRQRVARIAILTGCVAALPACGPEPLVGTWQFQPEAGVALLELQDGGVGTESREISVLASCVGSASSVLGQARVRVSASVEWTDTGDGYEIEWTCETASLVGPGDCAVYGCLDVAAALEKPLGFDAACALDRGGDSLRCSTKDGETLTYARASLDPAPVVEPPPPEEGCGDGPACGESEVCALTGGVVACQPVCASDAECETGCCAVLLGGRSACLPGDYCEVSP